MSAQRCDIPQQARHLDLPAELVARIDELQQSCRDHALRVERLPEPVTFDDAFLRYQAHERHAASYTELAQAYRELRHQPNAGALRTALSHAAAWADDTAHAISENALAEGERFLRETP